jgi:hypothetical protein
MIATARSMPERDRGNWADVRAAVARSDRIEGMPMPLTHDVRRWTLRVLRWVLGPAA